MNLSPGHLVQLQIQDIAFGGEGVARIESKVQSPKSKAGEETDSTFVVFVPFVLVGERVEAEITEVKKSFARARLIKILEAAPERVEPACRYFGACGGCQYQHIAYETQLRIKHKQISDLFQRIGGFAPGVIAPVVPCPQPYGYRNRIMIRSQWNKPEQKLNIGFVRWDGGLVEDITECKIAEPALNEEILRVRANPPPKGGIKVVLRIPPEDWEVPPDSFFQNNFFLLPKLVETVRGIVKGAGIQSNAPQSMEFEVGRVTPCAPGLSASESGAHGVTRPTKRHLIDLYCGVGFFGIELADAVASFVGVEYDRQAIKAARKNLATRGCQNGEFIAGMVEEVLPELMNKFSPAASTVLLDPPRKGCLPETLDLLRREKPSQIIYVSCHPATMARDLNILCAGGVFELARLTPLDMFPQTQHVECVADLRLVNSLDDATRQTGLANAERIVSTGLPHD